MTPHLLDLSHGVPNTIAAFLYPAADGAVLIETGPESCFDRLAGALARHHLEPRDVRHVFVSHVHLDHAGAAWRLAALGATIYVHPAGAGHLSDPSRLWASATRIYGDKMAELWGRMEPVPAARLRPLQDGEVVPAGGLSIRALDTPGHAGHHLAYEVGDVIFTGDVAGVRIGRGPVVPPTPPPDIHLATWQASLRKLRARGARAFYLTHCGRFEDLEAHCAELERRLLDWAGVARTLLRRHGADEAAAAAAFVAHLHREYRDAGLNDREFQEYEWADPAWMSFGGLARYWKKHHPEALA